MNLMLLLQVIARTVNKPLRLKMLLMLS